MLSATKPALSQAVATARKGMLLAPQTTWDVLGSAFQTCGRLIRSPQNRDHFLDVLNAESKVINAQVIGQADLGFWRILGLYNDLNNPLFRKHDFDAQAFVEGAKLALIRFHDVQMGIQEDMHNNDAEESDDNTESSSAKDNGEEETATAEGKIMMQEAAVEAGLVAALGGDSALVDLEKIMNRTWEKEAEENPESPVAELKGMVTPEYLKILEVSSKTNYLLEKKFNYTADSGDIKNIALLSARAELFPLHDDVANANEDIDYSKPMSDPSLENPPRGEKDLPVVAQIEVLYDVDQVFTGKENSQDDESKDDGSIQMQIAAGESMPRTSVLVGVFEGWLHCDPDGNESVRWRLAFNRPAWEFNGGLRY